MAAIPSIQRLEMLSATAFSIRKIHCRLLAMRSVALILTCGFFLICSSSSAQHKISGIVSGENNLPLAGATITIKGTSFTTLSLSDGSFSLTVKTGEILEISFVGYRTQQIKISNETNLLITLQPGIVSLDEVVLTGYSTQKIKEITGSVSVVKVKDLVSVPAGQIGPMLQGRAAGLTVINSGEPGAPVSIRLHGQGNFGDVNLLYIIDGVPGDINSLNPNDIVSAQILKDAAASSVYGVRAANGVIVVATKKGKPGKTRISYDGYVGWQQPLKKGLDLLSPMENAEMIWQALKNSGQVGANGNPNHPMYGNGPSPVLPDYLFAGPNQGLHYGDPLADPALYNLDPSLGGVYQIVEFNKTGTDWFHEMFKPSFSQDHTVTVSGGSEKNLYFLSLGYLDQQGTLINTFLKRFSLRLNTELNYGKAFHIGENLQWSYTENPQSAKFSTNSAYSSTVKRSLITDPSWPVYDIKGAWNPGIITNTPGPDDNPLATQIHSKDNKDKKWHLIGNVFASLDFLKSFTAKTSFGGSITNYYQYDFRYGSYDYPNSGAPNQFAESSGYANSLTWTNTIEYSKKITNHSIKALIGTEMVNNYSRETGGSASDLAFSDPNYWLLNNGDPLTRTNFSLASSSKLLSFISKVDYIFKEKYLLTGTLRRDGSSVFGPENRFGWFPAIGAAWRMSEENFLQDSKWISELKLRASWGKLGFNGNTDPANQFTLYGGSAYDAYYDINAISSGSIQRGYRAVRLGNPKTGWQQDEIINLGIDAILWKGKLSITAELYNKKTKGLLFPISLPSLLGDVIPPNVNIGNIRNNGIDLTIESKGKFSKDMNWDITATFTHYKNKIIKLTDIPYFFDHFDLIKNEVGHPISSFFGYQIIGFFADSSDVNKSPIQPDAKTGRFKYADTNGRDPTGKLTGMPDGIINEADRVHFGNPHPDFTLGLNIALRYKNFDFSTFLYCSFGNDVLNFIRRDVELSPLSVGTKTAFYDSWTPTHKDAKTPILENSNNFSNQAVFNSYGLENGSYLRNKSLILGYTFPQKYLSKIKFERLRIYFQVVNLFTITGYTGLDPELSRSSGIKLNDPNFSNSFFGIDHGNYPGNQKQFLIGVNLGL